jgi:alpha-L-fucosidase 2
MQWKDGNLISVSIRSNLGGNLRLRTPNQINIEKNKNIKVASGENPNVFYQVNETAKPIISKESNIKLLDIKPTYLYDVNTTKTGIYTFVIK